MTSLDECKFGFSAQASSISASPRPSPLSCPSDFTLCCYWQVTQQKNQFGVEMISCLSKLGPTEKYLLLKELLMTFSFPLSGGQPFNEATRCRDRMILSTEMHISKGNMFAEAGPVRDRVVGMSWGAHGDG